MNISRTEYSLFAILVCAASMVVWLCLDFPERLKPPVPASGVAIEAPPPPLDLLLSQ